MSTSASKRFMNWTAVSFTPDNGTPIVFTGVSSVAFDSGGSIAAFSGDADRYHSFQVNDFNEPTAKVETADVGAVNSCVVGQTGIFTATHNDAKNGAGTGAITYTLRAIVAKVSSSGKHRAYGMADVQFNGNSADGQTNPLSTSVAA